MKTDSVKLISAVSVLPAKDQNQKDIDLNNQREVLNGKVPKSVFAVRKINKKINKL